MSSATSSRNRLLRPESRHRRRRRTQTLRPVGRRNQAPRLQCGQPKKRRLPQRLNHVNIPHWHVAHLNDADRIIGEGFDQQAVAETTASYMNEILGEPKYAAVMLNVKSCAYCLDDRLFRKALPYGRTEGKSPLDFQRSESLDDKTVDEWVKAILNDT